MVAGPDVTRSDELFARACAVIPGGVHSPVRAFAAVSGTPRFIERGFGSHIWDVDGNEYVDYVMSWGPLINGHAFGPVVRSIESQAAFGTSYGAPTASEVDLANAVVDAVDSVDMVRFVSSGTEATMSALRLARAATGRPAIIKFAGNYHGHSDALLARAGSGSLTLGVPTSPGVPESAAAMTIVLPYNDSHTLRDTLALRDDIAAVIVEPIAGNMGVVSPDQPFINALRDAPRENGALLIVDEVITGFRVARGGAQSFYGLQPDLSTFGKIIGGGLPVGAYGGRRDLMEQLAPSGPVYQAGTLSGNPLAMVAGLANLSPTVTADFYDRLGVATETLARELRAVASSAGVPVTVNFTTGMLTVFFTAGAVRNLDDAEAADTQRYARFFHSMLGQGIYLPPSQFEAWMLSAAHTTQDLERTVAAAQAAFQEMSAG